MAKVTIQLTIANNADSEEESDPFLSFELDHIESTLKMAQRAHFLKVSIDHFV